MALTLDEVRNIATLARLRLSPEEEARFVPQLGRIVEYIDQLGKFDQHSPEDGSGTAAEALDRPGGTLPRERFLANAPDSMDAFLVVPQVKGDSDA